MQGAANAYLVGAILCMHLLHHNHIALTHSEGHQPRSAQSKQLQRSALPSMCG